MQKFSAQYIGVFYKGVFLKGLQCKMKCTLEMESVWICTRNYCEIVEGLRIILGLRRRITL